MVLVASIMSPGSGASPAGRAWGRAGFWGALRCLNTFTFTSQVKKLVYVYLVRYAEEQQDLALLSISTFQRGLKVGCSGDPGGAWGSSKPPVAALQLPHVPTGSQPADPRQRPAGPLQHPCAHHRAHHDAGHKGGRLGHVSLCAQDSRPCHPQAVQVMGLSC